MTVADLARLGRFRRVDRRALGSTISYAHAKIDGLDARGHTKLLAAGALDGV